MAAIVTDVQRVDVLEDSLSVMGLGFTQ